VALVPAHLFDALPQVGTLQQGHIAQTAPHLIQQIPVPAQRPQAPDDMADLTNAGLLPGLRNETEFATLCDRVMPTGYAELPVDRLDVALERIHGDVQLLADFAERLRALE